MAGDNMRIGDAERDEAVSMLQEHHAAGRLSTEEFDDRMSKALEARTGTDLTGLFLDLPAPRPSYGRASIPQPEPIVAPWASTPPTQDVAPWGAEDGGSPQSIPRPWFAQWWIILPFVFIGFRLWWIIPMVALWLWVIYPSIEQGRARRQVAAVPPRPLTYAERDQVMALVRSNNKIHAIKRYRELTGADLKTAKFTVDAWSREIGR
ncbi:MAG: DUF1707 domain-containing protein [Arachnia sp.]